MFGLRMSWAMCVACLATGILAQKSATASTFYFEKTQTQFSLSLAENASDVFVYFASPAYSWAGVGFGGSMRDSLMLVMYPNADGDSVTVSPRLSTSHSEPSFAPNIDLEILNGTGIQDDMFVLKALCRMCRVWPGGFLDASSTAQPMIFAFGTATILRSNDPNAPLRRHVEYGHFTMDMVAATSSDAAVPQPATQLQGATVKDAVKDHDRKNLAHAFMGAVALFVLWPLNVVFAGFLRNIRVHVGMSVFILVFLVVSYALGIATSPQYNRSKNYTSAHQILALVSLAPTLLMSLLPTRPVANLHPWIPRLHTPLTNLAFTLLVLTGGLGLRLSAQPNPIVLAYVAVALIVFGFTAFVVLCVRRRGSAYRRATVRRRLGEEDERDFGLARWGVGRKLGEMESRSGSEEGSSWDGRGEGGFAGVRAGSQGQGQGDWRGVVGGGTMPGPQYLLNMHPGVPVYVK